MGGWVSAQGAALLAVCGFCASATQAHAHGCQVGLPQCVCVCLTEITPFSSPSSNSSSPPFTLTSICGAAAAHTRHTSEANKEGMRAACMESTHCQAGVLLPVHTLPCFTNLVPRCCCRGDTLQRICQAADCGLCHVCCCRQARVEHATDHVALQKGRGAHA